MGTFEQLKWAVAHDACSPRYRAPAGAVGVLPAGEGGARTRVRVVLHVEPALYEGVAAVAVRVGELPAGGAVPVWREVAATRCGEGYAAEIALEARPHVAYYAFAIRCTGGEEFLYVPCADGRATFGEVVREGVDGRWTEAGWRWHAWRLPAHDANDFCVPEPLGGFQITVYDQRFSAPEWLRGAVMYQIFPDRFARGLDGVRREGVAYHEHMGRPVKLHESWDEPADWEGASWIEARRPGPDGTLPIAYDPVDFFGGTLAGIREKLPYLASLGVEVVYLNPVFEARSNHRYDTADYLRIDPLLGSDEDFAGLCEDARGYGISIVLDAVLSHTGADSRYFNALGTYAQVGAAQGEDSPYRAWYDFTPMDEVTPYRCWWGDPSLPEVDERSASWQRFMLGKMSETTCPFDSSEGVLPRWIGLGAAGYRIDVADEIPDDVLERIRASVKGANPEAALIGEVWEDATSKVSYGAARTYALGRALDSVMNYPLRNALLGFALGTVDAHQLAAFLNLQAANYPSDMHACLMNLLSSHDVERVRSVLALGGRFKQETRADQRKRVVGITSEQDAQAARLQRMTAALLYALPGTPCLYYGDEAGLQGGGDPFCRETFPWDAEARMARADVGEDLATFYQKLGQLRKGSPVLRCGASFALPCSEDAMCVVRLHESDIFIALANRSDTPQRIVLDLADALRERPETAAFQRSGQLDYPVVFAANDAPELPLQLQDGILRCVIPSQSAVFLSLS